MVPFAHQLMAAGAASVCHNKDCFSAQPPVLTSRSACGAADSSHIKECLWRSRRFAHRGMFVGTADRFSSQRRLSTCHAAPFHSGQQLEATRPVFTAIIVQWRSRQGFTVAQPPAASCQSKWRPAFTSWIVRSLLDLLSQHRLFSGHVACLLSDECLVSTRPVFQAMNVLGPRGQFSQR